MSLLSEAILCPRLLAKVLEYNEIPSVVGYERCLLDYLERDFRSIGAHTHSTPKVLAVKNGEGPIFICHIDRPGLLGRPSGDFVYAAQAVGGQIPEKLGQIDDQLIENLTAQYQSSRVYAYDPDTGGRYAYGDVSSVAFNDDHHLCFQLSDMPSLPGNMPVAFSRQIDGSKSGYITGFLDNIVSVVSLRLAMEFGLTGTILFVCEAETGQSASHIVNYAKDVGWSEATTMVSVDVSVFDDAATALAGAVILHRRDQWASFDALMVGKLETAISGVGAPIIFKDSFIERENDARARRGLPQKPMERTDIGALIAHSKGQFSGASIQIPVFRQSLMSLSTSVRAKTALIQSLVAISKQFNA